MEWLMNFVMIKYNIEEHTFFIIDKKRTKIYDSKFGFMDLKVLSLKDELDIKEIDKLITFMKPLMINATDRNTINVDKYQFHFNKLLASRDIKIQNDVLLK